MLEVGSRLSGPESVVLYVSGEESVEQSKLRASRLGVNSAYLYVSCETNLEEIVRQIDDLGPRVVIIDSIQTIYREDYSSAPGSVAQIRESTAYLMKLAKHKKITIFLIGHVTKEGAIAGPRILEHVVDTVLYFESGRDYQYRILRVVKNRFGPVKLGFTRCLVPYCELRKMKNLPGVEFIRVGRVEEALEKGIKEE